MGLKSRGRQGGEPPKNRFAGVGGGWPAPANVFFGAVSLPAPEIGIFSSENKQRACYRPKKCIFTCPNKCFS